MGLNKTQYSQQNIHSSGFFWGEDGETVLARLVLAFMPLCLLFKQTSNSINLFTGKIFT